MSFSTSFPIERAVREVAERRTQPRRKVTAAVDLTSNDNFYSGVSNDLSEGGVFVATHALLPRGQRVELEIELPDGRGPVWVDGEIRWVREPSAAYDLPVGMGIKFIGLREIDRRRIQQFVNARDTVLYED